jgi:hypothetical protein
MANKNFIAFYTTQSVAATRPMCCGMCMPRSRVVSLRFKR